MPAKLPQQLDLNQMQNKWAAIIDPVTTNPANNSLILHNISLVTGTNVVNHKLGRKLQGWKVVRQKAAASLYDTQDSNQMPELTLQLVSSANVTVSLEVF